MADTTVHKVLDVNRHGGTEVPSKPIAPPKVGEDFELDDNVIDCTDPFHFNPSPRT